MNMRKRCCIFLSGVVALLCLSQAATAAPNANTFADLRKHQAVGILVGAHYWQSPWAELGITRARYRDGLFGGYYRGSAWSLLYNPLEQTAGMSFSRWYSHFSVVVTGFRICTYSDFEQVRFTLQPQAGIGNGVFTLCYGYAFALNREVVGGINLPHEVSLRWNIEVWEAKRERWWQRNK